MKGKRKVKTKKWQVAEQFKAAAQAALRARSARANRFLDAALLAGRDLEPVGLLAGTGPRRPPHFTSAGDQ
ncbi:hypothetical protein PS726_01872 [Pseudomonas fluorescens]|nr:hypothetical protein PS647_01265 [Pseudomonas fluorescens]VVN90915.1 hypothetical protein PS726_01872 [Pseudomonas fluorescens]VVO57112.1 hypothetical protein PS843_00585 [Pseudomonas fluorescens]